VGPYAGIRTYSWLGWPLLSGYCASGTDVGSIVWRLEMPELAADDLNLADKLAECGIESIAPFLACKAPSA
jgi:hypothetical protein